MDTTRHAAGGALRAGALDGALRPRVVGLAESLPGPSWFALLIETGRAWVADEEDAIEGPALVWRSWARGARAHFAAGATGSYVVLGTGAFASVVGYTPALRDLHGMAGRRVTASLADGGDRFDTLRFAFQRLNRELGSDRVAAAAVVDAYLRVILVEAYRASQADSAQGEAPPASQRAFARFSELVETHFRDRWTVNDYALALGMSRDRLGDICRRSHGLGPKELIDRRVAVEARHQLETSSNSIQEISNLLGFGSPPQFTRFFHRRVGMTPGAFRVERTQARQADATEQALSYEWP